MLSLYRIVIAGISEYDYDRDESLRFSRADTRYTGRMFSVMRTHEESIENVTERYGNEYQSW
jgi:hypothetical protein